jgi:hypothetical protein
MVVLKPELLTDKGLFLRLRPRVEQQLGHAKLRIQAGQFGKVRQRSGAQRDPAGLQCTGVDRRAATMWKRTRAGACIVQRQIFDARF